MHPRYQPFLCHLQPGTCGDARARKVDALIERIVPGADGVWSAEGRTWVSLPGRGAPFDGQNAAAVETALRSAGLWPIVG